MMRSARYTCRAFFSAIIPLGLLITSGCGSSDGTTPTASISGARYAGVETASEPAKPRFNLHPIVQVTTSAGEFTLQLDAERAPLTVDNFLAYVEARHYDGTIFHQVFDGFIILGGGYDAKSTERPANVPVRNEAHNGLKNTRGTVAMARQADAIDSATCQFFVNVADNASLDHTGSEPAEYGYCVFGEVTEGMSVIDQIASAPVGNAEKMQNVPVRPVVIESMRRVK